MKICHVCNAECENDAELCPICGAMLANEPEPVAEVDDAQAEEKAIIENPTLLASFEDIVSAEIFKDVLKDSDITFSCSSEMGQNSIQVLFGGGFVSEDIYVSEADLEQASIIYEAFLNSEADFEGEFVDDEALEDTEDED